MLSNQGELYQNAEKPNDFICHQCSGRDYNGFGVLNSCVIYTKTHRFRQKKRLVNDTN